MPMMPQSGVRSSWLTVARKRDFAALAASALRCAPASASSERRRSVMSRPTDWRSMRPSGSRTMVSSHEIQRRPRRVSISWSKLRAPSAVSRTSPVWIDLSEKRAPMIASRRGFEKSGIRVDDPVALIATQDEIVLALDEAAVTLLAFPGLPDLVAQALDLGLVQGGSRFGTAEAKPQPQHRRDAAERHRDEE